MASYGQAKTSTDGTIVGAAFLGVSEGIDPAVAIVRDGRVLAFMEEERLLRYKHAKDLYPFNALKYCLWQADVRPEDITAIAVHADVPAYSDGRMAEYFRQMAEQWPLDHRTIDWQRTRLSRLNAKAVEARHARAWRRTFGAKPLPKIHAIAQHRVHALHAFLQSPFDDALCLTIDGSGDRHCTVLWSCRSDNMKPVYEIAMPHSLGWFYAAFTEYLGFEAYDGEYKMMGLSAYGRPNMSLRHKVAQVLREAPDGIGYVVDPSYLHYGEHTWSDRHTDKLVELFGRTPRHPDDKLDEWHHDLAFAVQEALEIAVERLVRWGLQEAGSHNVCLGGGVGLNVNLCTRLAKLEGVERPVPPSSRRRQRSGGRRCAWRLLGANRTAIRKVEHARARQRAKRWRDPHGSRSLPHRLRAAGRHCRSGRARVGKGRRRGLVSGADGGRSSRPRPKKHPRRSALGLGARPGERCDQIP